MNAADQAELNLHRSRLQLVSISLSAWAIWEHDHSQPEPGGLHRGGLENLKRFLQSQIDRLERANPLLP